MNHRLISPAEASALIRRSVRQFASDKVEGPFEAGFREWLESTVFADAVDRMLKEIGDDC